MSSALAELVGISLQDASQHKRGVLTRIAFQPLSTGQAASPTVTSTGGLVIGGPEHPLLPESHSLSRLDPRQANSIAAYFDRCANIHRFRKS
jgi:hypothetical protein